MKWKLSTACDKLLFKVKQRLVSSRVLVHYDCELPLRLATDASDYGVGAVISHVFPNGEEKPIAFASRTHTQAEKNYPQIEKEALSIVYGVKKFHQYLYARKFSLITDHKPLVSILIRQRQFPHCLLLECNDGHFSCQPITIPFLIVQPRSMLMLMHCLDCH